MNNVVFNDWALENFKYPEIKATLQGSVHMINLMNRKAWEPPFLFIPFLNHNEEGERTELHWKKSAKVKNIKSSNTILF